MFVVIVRLTLSKTFCQVNLVHWRIWGLEAAPPHHAPTSIDSCYRGMGLSVSLYQLTADNQLFWLVFVFSDHKDFVQTVHLIFSINSKCHLSWKDLAFFFDMIFKYQAWFLQKTGFSAVVSLQLSLLVQPVMLFNRPVLNYFRFNEWLK